MRLKKKLLKVRGRGSLMKSKQSESERGPLSQARKGKVPLVLVRLSNRVRAHVTEDLSSMGFCLVSYTVTKTKIDDAQGYMKALGATQTGHDSMTAWPKAGGKETVPSQSSPCSYGLVDDPFGVSASDRRRQWTPSCDTRCARRRKDVLACRRRIGASHGICQSARKQHWRR
jgi:hypothetical protein